MTEQVSREPEVVRLEQVRLHYGKIHALGQRAGDGGRERATGAMRVAGLDALVAEPRGERIAQVVALVIERRGLC